ncbi:hypothetical protein IV203_010092 [Nitzschia inconspicua]|uniref:Uncharacterized protein n=1 Tax=Nitzschia inconspicua TaxID=303405 RepID=A0A9K3K5I4_9STRA|nr:hypothetical protein IV203_033502 [Nitzschia inconspicua]KAG7350732.1 hypothetical protein IV203_010092 [Nitzschia inconspicua]
MQYREWAGVKVINVAVRNTIDIEIKVDNEVEGLDVEHQVTVTFGNDPVGTTLSRMHGEVVIMAVLGVKLQTPQTDNGWNSSLGRNVETRVSTAFSLTLSKIMEYVRCPWHRQRHDHELWHRLEIGIDGTHSPAYRAFISCCMAL